MKIKRYMMGMVFVFIGFYMIDVCYAFWTDKLVVQGEATLTVDFYIIDDSKPKSDDKSKKDDSKKDDNKKDDNKKDGNKKDNNKKDNLGGDKSKEEDKSAQKIDKKENDDIAATQKSKLIDNPYDINNRNVEDGESEMSIPEHFTPPVRSVGATLPV